MTLPSDAIDIIATQILLDTKGVLASLKNLDQKTESSATRIAMIAKSLQAMANSAGVSIDAMAQKLQKLNAAGGGKFGTLGVSSTDISRAAQVAQGVENIGKAAEKTKAPIQNIGKEMENSSKKTKWSIDVIRTALGVLTAMMVNVVITAFTKFFKDSSKMARELEDSLWRIHAAEIALSRQGIDVSFSGFTEGAAKISKELKIFANQDVLNALSDAASGLAKFGFTEEQILSLTRGAAIMNVVSNNGETLEQTMNAVMTSLISPQGKSIASLNIGFGETVMTAKALEMQLIKTGESAADLTAEENRQVKYAIFLDEVNKYEETFGDYLETNTAKIQANTKAWRELEAVLGQIWNNIIPNMVPVFEELQREIETSKLSSAFIDALTAAERFSLQNNVIVAKLATGIALTQKEYDHLKETLESMSDEDILKIFPDPSSIKNRFVKELVSSLVELKETATELPDPIVGEVLSQDALDALGELEKDLLEVAADAETARRELQILTQQKYDDIRIDAKIKLEEIELKFQQDVADAERELQQEIDDIHIEARQAEADAMRQYREDQLRAEAEYQQKLKELREQFLMDLDEALHARDARQVLKLIKQYEFEKQQAKERKELDDKLRKERLQAELESIRIEEQRRVEAAQREFARKMQELEIEKQREIEAANEAEKQKLEELARWNAAEMEEIDRHAKDKMEKLTAAYEAEFGAHKLYQEMINRVIAEYTAANIRAMQDMYNYMVGLYAQIGAMYTSSQGMLNSMGGVVGAPQPQNPFPYHPGGYAEGGSVIAMRPTRAIFGERGPELATFTPLGRDGRDINKLFGDLPSSAGGGGRMLIEMLLSPDLEARVIENSLSRTADVFARVSRSK